MYFGNILGALVGSVAVPLFSSPAAVVKSVNKDDAVVMMLVSVSFSVELVRIAEL